MARHDFPAPSEGFVLTHFIVAEDVARSRDFYVGVLGGTVVLEGEPTIVKLANGWVIINVGGGPTDDKPEVGPGAAERSQPRQPLPEPPGGRHPGCLPGVALQGGGIPHPPKDHGREIRSYMRNPDAHLIEVGQATIVPASG